MQAERPIVIDGAVAYIQLTHGYVAVIDAEDVHLVGGQNWHARRHGRTVYAMANIKRDGKRTTIRLHNVILPPSDGLEVDHKNGDGLDNKKGNLRLATHQENSWNRTVSSNNTSGCKGVLWEKCSGMWRVRIGLDGRRIHVGRYRDFNAAKAAYEEASHRFYGEFARVTGNSNSFKQAPADVVEARVKWLGKAHA